ncbi:DUF2489 domain-containing protein [Agaribacterium sp. ZY112]|uniref:DUF2489 domain-containing protein n=1 Tax=Agaribacterium sp. ZY112 TaxID=3233574 RepID=UPI0035263928
MHFFALSLATLIIIALAAYAISLHLKLHKRQKEIQKTEQDVAKQITEKQLSARKDIGFLALAYINEQVELAEVSLRISKLAQYLELDEQQQTHYQVFNEVASTIANIPTHKQWKQLSKKDKAAHQRTFKQLEELHTDNAKISAQQIVDLKQRQ